MKSPEDKKDLQGQQKDGTDTQTDRGWAWVVLLAAFFETYLLMGCHSSFGLYYKEFLTYYNTTASTISFALSVQTVFISVGSLLVMSVGQRLCSTRVFVMLGGVTGCTAYMLNSFAPNPYFLMLSQGVFFGSTHALCHGPMLLTLGRYFCKRRGLATTLSSIGASVGGLTMPLFIRFLIDEFGLQGSLMILSGVLFNFMVTGALLRPIVLNKARNLDSNTDAETERLAPETLEDKNEPKKNRSEFLIEKDGREITLFVPEKAGSTSQLHIQYDRLLPEPVERMRTYSSTYTKKPAALQNSLKTGSATSVHRTGHLPLHDKLLIQLTASTGDITGGSALSVASLGSAIGQPNHNLEHRHDGDADDNEQPPGRSCILSLKNILIHIFDKNVTGNILFRLFIPVAFFAIIGCAQMLVFVPSHARDIGLTNEEVSYLFIISGAADTICKLFIAAISDCHFIQRYQIVALNVILGGIVINFVPLFTDFKSMVLLALANGMFGQIYFGLFPVILADFVGITHLSSAIGMVLLVHGIGLSVSNPLLGYIRDVTGSFVLSFHIMATSQIISGLILFSVPVFRKMENKRKEAEQNGGL